ncbi:SecY-interacting protein Syd [Clostridium sp. HMSC19A10]|uniref:SecY-interacting protein Syd n=1 Tax=Clostridium sp. HMSC19A10 TaxID=1581148 RepID=UPI0008AD8AE6|nr:SecY-interacting protein Syd [Clostridium sp. HMSC19A10]OFS21214.1 hypothetical protein HMPREF3070_13965 [Clostridium sp. HMSC19A10]
MNIKDGMGEFFEKMLTGYEQTSQGLPMRPKTSIDKGEIFVGKENEDGWSRWKPIKKDTKEEFKNIENLLSITINNDIKEYFNSYWFLELKGDFKKKTITLEPVIPGRELKKFERKLKGYIEVHDGNNKYIPIGSEANTGYLIVMENSTGIIKLENHDTGKFRSISENLYELIANLEPVVIDFED